MRLTKIGRVLIPVHDLARSKDFYTRVLGFEILEEDPDHGGLFMTTGEGTHVIDLVPLPGTSRQGHRSVRAGFFCSILFSIPQSVPHSIAQRLPNR